MPINNFGMRLSAGNGARLASSRVRGSECQVFDPEVVRAQNETFKRGQRRHRGLWASLRTIQSDRPGGALRIDDGHRAV